MELNELMNLLRANNCTTIEYLMSMKGNPGGEGNYNIVTFKGENGFSLVFDNKSGDWRPHN